MQFNSSLNRFGNLRDNQYRELVNDEFNDARSQVIARQFMQTKQFLESYEREKVGDRLVNLEVAKTITKFNNAIIQSTSDIDNNKPNSEEGIIIAYRTAVDMLDAYVNASGTKTRDTERYRGMLFQAVPALNTYYEKASQLDKIGYVDVRQLERIADIIGRLESGYTQGQVFNGKNTAANVVSSSLDEEVQTLFKDLRTQSQILQRILDVSRSFSYSEATVRFYANVSDLLYKRVYPVLDYVQSGKIDYKGVARIFNIEIQPTAGKIRAKQKKDREDLLQKVIDKLRELLLAAKGYVDVASDATSPINQPQQAVQPATLPPPAPPAPPAPAPAPAPAPPDAIAPEGSTQAVPAPVASLLFKLYNEALISFSNQDKAEKEKNEERKRGYQQKALEAEEKMRAFIAQIEHMGYPKAAQEQIERARKEVLDIRAAGRKRGGVARTNKSSKHVNLPYRNESLKFEKRQVKEFNEEPSLKFVNLFPNYQKGVNFHTEGSGKKKNKKNVILFDRI
jgi:hypothetical protein